MRTQSLCLSAVLNLSMKIYWICASCDASGTDYYIWRDKIIFSFSEAIANAVRVSLAALISEPHTEYNIIKSHQRKGFWVYTHTHGNDNLFCIRNSFDWKYFFTIFHFFYALFFFFRSLRHSRCRSSMIFCFGRRHIFAISATGSRFRARNWFTNTRRASERPIE